MLNGRLTTVNLRIYFFASPYFKLYPDVRELFPYINGTIKDARYHIQPLHIQFNYKRIQCTLYPSEVLAAPFQGRDHALDFIEDLVALLNDLYDRRNEITRRNTFQTQPVSIVEIIKALPRTNCQKCGYASCMAFAAALRIGETTPATCPGFTKPISICTVYPVFGNDGTIESTFTIEEQIQQPKNKTPERGEITQRASDQKPPLYDKFGIRVQYNLTNRETQCVDYLPLFHRKRDADRIRARPRASSNR